jgi:hypothetical protein
VGTPLVSHSDFSSTGVIKGLLGLVTGYRGNDSNPKEV